MDAMRGAGEEFRLESRGNSFWLYISLLCYVWYCGVCYYFIILPKGVHIIIRHVKVLRNDENIVDGQQFDRYQQI